MAGRLSSLRTTLLLRKSPSYPLRFLPISRNICPGPPPPCPSHLSLLFHHLHSITASANLDSSSNDEITQSSFLVVTKKKSEVAEAVESKKVGGNEAKSSKKPESRTRKQKSKKGLVSGKSEPTLSGKDTDGKTEELDGMKRKLRELEEEVKMLRQNAILKKPLMTEKRDGIGAGVAGGLASLFGGYKPVVVYKGKRNADSIREKVVRVEDGSSSEVEMSPEAVAFLERLQEDGYLSNVILMQDGKIVCDRSRQGTYAQNMLKSAAEKFGIEHQEIAKWLSGSNLKKVAIYGCPSVERKSVFAAKRLRSFFSIQEDVVCRACKLKSSCKFVNQNFIKSDKLILSDALRVLTLYSYSFSQVPQQLVISTEMKESIAKLLKEIVSLSK